MSTIVGVGTVTSLVVTVPTDTKELPKADSGVLMTFLGGLMPKRKRLNRRKASKIFKRGAKVHGKNKPKLMSRGGIRL